MKYTSLSHWNTGHNVQQNWNSVEEWQDYCIEDSSVIWSKLFTSVDGEFIEEYPERLQRYTAITGTNEYGLDMGYLSEKLNILLRDISRHTPSEAARVLARLSMVADEKVLSEPEFVKQPPAVAVPDDNPNEWIIEKLSYHKFERNDLNIDGCLNYLESEWKEIQGRTTRQLVMQILELLAAAPSPRITEQDVLHILEGFHAIYNRYSWCHFYTSWIKSADYQTLLGKLNRESK